MHDFLWLKPHGKPILAELDAAQTEIRMNPGREVVLLTIAQAAERLSVSMKTLRRIVGRGDLPVVRLGTDGKSDRIEEGI